MWETIRNAFKIKEVRNKILWTIFFVIIYRLGCYITVPGLGAITFENNNDIVGLLDSITGSALSQGTLFSLGITPYINASIIVQLLTVAIPALERMSKEGEEGKEKINKITRWVTLVLAIVSAVGVVLTLGQNDAYIDEAWLGSYISVGGNNIAIEEFLKANEWIMYIYIIIMLVGGSMLTMWIGERITEKGISNGISLLIFVGIVATAAQELGKSFIGVFEGNVANLLSIGLFLVTLILVFAFIVWVDGAERKIKVQYAKQVKGNKMYGGQSTFIPIKVNASGVMPLIFAYALMSFVPMIAQSFAPTSDFTKWWTTWMTANGNWCGIIVYNVILAILIFVFAYFYSQIQFNPSDIAKNIQNNGGFVTGIRPGRETSEYLTRVVRRITLWGAIFLTIINLIPSILFTGLPSWIPGVSLNPRLVSSFSATGMLIVVSVALEFNKALENQILMRNYKGFLK